MAQPKSKPLSFGTTLRNPERIIHFLRIIKNYESKILDNNLIFEILEDIIINKLYKPTFIGQNDFYNKIYESDQLFTKKEAKEIINNSIQNHKEHGFDYGWPSRFDTFYKLIMEFGYCYYAMNKPIEISELGNILIKSYNEDDNENIMSCFLNSMVKFQTASPFKKNEHKNIPLVLLLKVINLLKEKGYTNGIYRKEISLFICWPNNNPKELCEYIINFRNKYNYNYSDTLIYEECLELFLDENNNSIKNLYKYIKETKILKETVDEYIRKMRITGIISLRGNGNFIDINTNENNKVEYVLNNYGDLIDIYEDNIISKYKYYNYISKVDKNLFKKTITNYTGLNIKKQKLLLDYAQKFNDSQLNYELKCCYTNKTSEDDVLKYIDKPTRLELLSAVCLVKYFDNINVIPNYSVDDEGLPTFTARGGVADIDCINENYYGLFEVTLMRSKALQTEHEIPSIKDHLENIDSNFSQKTFSYFVAPVITDRAELFINFINNCEINSNKCYGIKQLKIENVIEKFISCNRDFSKLI